MEMSQRMNFFMQNKMRAWWRMQRVIIGPCSAASDWGGIAEHKRVRPALAGSYERLFHETGAERFWIDLRAKNDAVKLLRQRRLERAIGVIYRPETERWSHYFEACLPDQFDV